MAGKFNYRLSDLMLAVCLIGSANGIIITHAQKSGEKNYVAIGLAMITVSVLLGFGFWLGLNAANIGKIESGLKRAALIGLGILVIPSLPLTIFFTFVLLRKFEWSILLCCTVFGTITAIASYCFNQVYAAPPVNKPARRTGKVE
jgi:hypothetical protein